MRNTGKLSTVGTTRALSAMVEASEAFQNSLVGVGGNLWWGVWSPGHAVFILFPDSFLTLVMASVQEPRLSQ